ncbi:hypothetical protein CDV55_105072 [Aspergillus turcosus]|nr:hypothetical protein CDV55_105072 [Aspergillus turcosus]
MALERMEDTKATLSHEDYTVGWICALPVEAATAKAMLDRKHPRLPSPPNDNNSYTLGEIDGHNIVIACLPTGVHGTTSAAAAAAQMLMTFTGIRIGLMVGIGGGVPSEEVDIRLGDVVVSKPGGGFGGVIQYDYGKTTADGKVQRTGTLNMPPHVLLTAVANLESEHMMGESQIPQILEEMVARFPSMAGFTYPGQEHDRLFEAEGDSLVPRPNRSTSSPGIHYGLIASGNQVMKDARTRDRLARELGIICFEMEAAGLMNHFPCLVIRGVSDYCDSRKNDLWQRYAAAVAAAYAREVLSMMPVIQVERTLKARDALDALLRAEEEKRFHVPFSINDMPAVHHFVGRESDLLELWSSLQPSSSPDVRKVVILHGLGGIGKTQLAIQFARRYKNEFSAVFWLNGRNWETLVRSLASYLPRIPEFKEAHMPRDDEEVERNAKEVLNWLAIERNSRWLLIFDNVDHYSASDTAEAEEYDLKKSFPPADHGSMIVTTRFAQLTELGKSQPVQKLGQADAIQLLVNSAGLTGTPVDVDEDIKSLAQRLDGLPLATVIAGAFIRHTGVSLSHYLHHYEQSWHSIQSNSTPLRDYSNGNMLTTWMITFQEIQKRSEPAAKLLHLLAHFDNYDIWYELIRCGLEMRHHPDWFRQTVVDEIVFLTTIRILVDFSLIDLRRDKGSYSMHPVVQDWCRMGTGVENQDEFRTIALNSTGAAVPNSTERDYWLLQQRLLPHAKNSVLMLQSEWSVPQDEQTLQAINKLGLLYNDQGMLKEAEKLHQYALRGKEATLGLDHLSTMETVNQLGNVYADQGRLKEAETMYQRALAGRQKLLGADHTLTLQTMNNLGTVY